MSVIPIFAHAGINPTITWSPTSGVNIGGVNDVVTTGTLVGAFNLGTTGVLATTVNGVPFAALAVPDDNGAGTTTVGNYSLNFNGGRHADNAAFGSSSSPYSALPAAYQTLLSSGVAAESIGASFGTITLSMTGLTSGQTYTFEWWANNAGNFASDGKGNTTATATNAVTLNDEVNGASGGPGQYAVGTFTASFNGTEQITFTSPDSPGPVLNGFEVRTVPEPTSTAVIAIGSLSLFALWRQAARAVRWQRSVRLFNR